jgi:hypothetical protein
MERTQTLAEPTTTSKPWPTLDFANYRDTLATVHLWTQIIGKIRMKKMPWLNHSWHVTLYVSTSGLTTGAIPYDAGIFQIDLDFIDHAIYISSSSGGRAYMKLYPRTVAEFYQELFSKLDALRISVRIHGSPNEVDPAIPFMQDTTHCSYDGDQMRLLWLALVRAEIVFTRFRAEFTGKVSPVHFFWGAFDLAVTRFSGRKAPAYAGAVVNIPRRVMEEAYSHEVSSCGFWPGNMQLPMPVFYSYSYPNNPEFGNQPVEPAHAFYSTEMGEFLLPYDAVADAYDPDETLLQFLRSTYRAAATAGKWSRNLECDLKYLEM